MWHVGNTPMWEDVVHHKMSGEFEQIVVHNKMSGEFNGEIVTKRTTQKNVLMRTQKNVACRKQTNMASCGAQQNGW